MDDTGFTLDSIREYLQNEGGKVEYFKLVKHFKRSLLDQDSRIRFKDYVNELAFVSQEGETKYLILRPQFVATDRRIISPHSNQSPFTDVRQVPHANAANYATSIPHIRAHSVYDESKSYGIFSPPPGEDTSPPQPPPRRKSLTIENKMRLLGEAKDEKESDSKSPPYCEQKLKEIHELSSQSAGRVKEHAKKLNKMASESELKPPMPTVNNSVDNQSKRLSKGKENVAKDSREDDNDSGSMQPLDPLRRRWMVTASSCDYSQLLQLLREDSKLASFKTALHWAAKFGRSDVVKLIAGTHGVDPNLKSVRIGGHTPLHLAAMFGHKDVMELLTDVYHANPNVRDYSGKLPRQYLKQVSLDELKSTAKNNHDSFNDRQAIGGQKSQPEGRRMSDASSSFIRIGSLNSKMRRTAYALTGIKSWGSAESLSENTQPKDHLMPPPSRYSLLKKKRNKKALSAFVGKEF
ncbi:ankyrin repeat domain-containing protein SOWAHB-like protein [Dinothrombium tinctorium]|uniref:Ankyrin repeat domain-containing protein SOWAHB-like protein n=1 Tax=Dinothrombium tinctorium TaxID=1965070 RepID=A0A443R8M9_9ACAR|nr:ankyrin repeat domain-containing protein SOWAHB-like protein [Dinothrombium tinctorium]